MGEFSHLPNEPIETFEDSIDSLRQRANHSRKMRNVAAISALVVGAVFGITAKVEPELLDRSPVAPILLSLEGGALATALTSELDRRHYEHSAARNQQSAEFLQAIDRLLEEN